MFKWLGKLWAAFTGIFVAKADALNENIHVVKKTFDDAQNSQTVRINEITNAVGSLIANKEAKLAKIKDLESQCEELENVKIGAQKMAQKRISELKAQGKSKTEIENDPEYIRCNTGHTDASSTLVEKRERISEYEERVESDITTISHHTAELQRLKGELERLHEEEAEHIADLESNKAVVSANKTLAGISQDKTDQELADIRKKRREVAGRAVAAQQLAGTDAKRATDSFLEAAKASQAASEFDSLMDWGEEETESNREASQLPE